jgi:hypothetical protein
VLIPINSTYFFEALYDKAKDIILNYANFVIIFNNTDIKRIIFLKTRLGRLSSAES